MRKTNLLLMLYVLAVSSVQTAFSKPVDVQTAQKTALTYYTFNSQNSNPSVLRLAYTRMEADKTVDFYIFDILPKGFVIVSGDDNADPVIAFSDETFFEANVPNSGIKDWLDDVANNMSYLITNHVQADAEITSKWTAYSSGQNVISSRTLSKTVSPLLTTIWNQNPLYNEYCPGGSVTGCVATAMAQIMKFWNWPTTGTGSYSYSDAPYGTLSANFGSTTYSWSSMPNSVTSNSTTTQENAVATLMYQVGVSVAMEYSPSGSGAYVIQSENPGGPCAQYSYVNYFGYSGSAILGVKKSSYTTAQWNSMMEKNLLEGYPIEYEGFGTDGGHTWVADGFNANGLVHMNWGWGGIDNGYFTLTNLNPSNIPLGSNDGALFNIVPLKKSTVNNGSQLNNNNLNSQQSVDLTAPDLNTESFNVYPIPTSTSLNIKYSGSIYSTSSISIVNTLGQVIAQYPSVNLNSNYELNISNYIAGVYFITVTSSNGDNRKVIKFLKD